MKSTILPFLFLLFSFSSLFAQNWKEEAINEHVSVEFPQGSLMQRDQQGIVYQFEEGIFMCQYNVIPEENMEAMKGMELKEFYDGVAEGVMADADAKPKPKMKKFKANGVEGRKMIFIQSMNPNEKAKMEVGAFIYKDLVISFIVAIPEGVKMKKEARHFFKSIRLH